MLLEGGKFGQRYRRMFRTEVRNSIKQRRERIINLDVEGLPLLSRVKAVSSTEPGERRLESLSS